jgi:hypothetical protein
MNIHVYNIIYTTMMAKQCSVMVNALEPRSIGAGFDPLACPSLMVPSGGETDVKLGFSLLLIHSG